MKYKSKPRTPPHLKQTPTNEPELLDIWRSMYDELIQYHSKSHVLEAIGDRYRVSRQTVMYHLSRAYKKKQRNRLSKKWSYEKVDPEIHVRRRDYNTQYRSARRNIEQLIRQSFQRASPKESMTMDDLIEHIHDLSGIFFKPSTVSGLVSRIEREKEYKLIVIHTAGDSTYYSLNIG